VASWPVRGATAEQQAEWKTIEAWMQRCSQAGTAHVRAQLKALGEAAPAIGARLFPGPLCAAAMSLNPPAALARDWDAFVAAQTKAKAAFDTFAFGAKLGFESAPFDPSWANEEARTLLRATVRDQVYRRAFDWPMHGPKLEPLVWEMLRLRISYNVTREDAKNTTVLKDLVAKNGWPTIQRVGARASDAAWLLVQHADQDPAFQLKALQLMAPLVASGGVDRRNYAYLYDRVMLKLNGKQRYATQVTCTDGKRVPQPLEEPGRVGLLREEVGLEPVADYLKGMDARVGTCPAQTRLKPVEPATRAAP
jgi:hypothetical protein